MAELDDMQALADILALCRSKLNDGGQPEAVHVLADEVMHLAEAPFAARYFADHPELKAEIDKLAEEE